VLRGAPTRAERWILGRRHQPTPNRGVGAHGIALAG
jgi:hypothetical protein